MIGKILIVDDERDMLALLKRIISEETDHQIITTNNSLEALTLLREHDFDLVITDLKMPKMNGIELFDAAKKMKPEVSFIILTAFATIETAVEAIQKGAYDYITKPFRRERILLTIEKVMEWQKMVNENTALRQALSEKEGLPSMIGSAPVMKEIFRNIKQVAPTSATVLITGPSGTGKELIARALHEKSVRKEKKLITVNCTAISEQVIESELFGHVKGAFTGAWEHKKGLVEAADQGTLFLDEIGDLNLPMQTKLLRLLQEGEYKPVGSVITKKADLRFIAATNHNLKEDIKEKKFREDLYYRLNVIHIELPSLKERRQDIPCLSHFFLKKHSLVNQKEIKSISHDAMQSLITQDFPGNVRELENTIERAVIFCKTDTLTPKDLVLENDREDLFSNVNPDILSLPFKDAKDKMIQLFHARYIQSILLESHGNVSKAAETAGIQRQYLHRLINETRIDVDAFKRNPGIN